ncbi:hypothetical protein GCM10011363_45800 [Marivita lacus]|uniref:DUF998 domain-containing protein n=1 Tax=Marivita lacus TaxID=1323742 RepID=A0ABQ1LFI8_9RHOB|nr:DUF998 domain-containing protein [Marivita lacus]GGC24134.1 hypothetical protein GCM10011363_45800 [Marivita lacus]
MTDETTEKSRVVAEERPELLILAGVAGLLGQIAPIVAMVIAIWLTGHQLLAETISELGQGRLKTIMDTGFYMNAAGLLALSIGAAHAHLGRGGWTVGVFCLALLALIVTLVGIWDNLQADDANLGNMTVHTKLTFALFPLYIAGPLAMARGVNRVSRTYTVLFVISATMFAVFAIAFKLTPTDYDGVIEKIAIGATMIWTTALSILFLNRGLRARN